MPSRADAERRRRLGEEMERAFAAVDAAVAETAARPRPVFDLPFAAKGGSGTDGETRNSKTSLGKEKTRLDGDETSLENRQTSLEGDETSLGKGDSSLAGIRLDGLFLDAVRLGVSAKQCGWESRRRKNVRRVLAYLFRRGVEENTRAFELHLKRSLVEETGVSPATATRLISEVGAARDMFFDQLRAVPGRGTTVVLRSTFFCREEDVLKSMNLLDSADRARSIAAMSGCDVRACDAAVAAVERAVAGGADEADALVALDAALRGVAPKYATSVLRGGLTASTGRGEAESLEKLFQGDADCGTTAGRFGTTSALLRERLFGMFFGAST